MMKATIRLRVAFYVTLSFAIVIVALSYVLTELYEGYSYRSFDVTLQAAASSVANRLANGNLRAGLSGIGEDIGESIADFENKVGLIHIGIFNATRREVLAFNDADSLVMKVPMEHGREFFSVRLEGKKYRAAFAYFELSDSTQGTVVALSSLAPLVESIDRIRGLAFIIAPITILLVGIGSIRLARRALKPLEKMAHDIDSIDAGSQTMKLFVPRTNDEIEKVAESFNALMDRIVSLINSQRNFLMDASHELKTPLTVIQAEIEMLQMKPNLTAEEKENLQHLVAEVEYASKLAVDLIYLSRLESSSANLGPVNVRPTIEESVAHQRPVAQRKGVALELEVYGDPAINGDPELLKRAFSNVIENAVKYTQRGGIVRVTAGKDSTNGSLVLTVEDNGSGINPDELQRVFDRFYRTKSARGGDEKGSGLGLSITRRIVEQHDGNIRLSSEPDKGTTVVIEIPLTI